LPARPANVPDPSTPGTAPPAPPQPGGLFTPTPATRAPAGTPPARTARAATPEAPERSPITVTPPSAQVDQSLERAYSAYQRGEIDAARDEYLKLLAREPNHRDALLGLAAIDVRTRNFDTAEMRYVRLLEIDPRDAHAHAGLIALNGTTDPVQSESRLKSLIAGQPDATHLYFSLGNQYAVQGRWGEAQDAYFKAFRADPDNPDFAYNLAVSLDHLRQAPLAAEYYRRAVSLAAQRPAAFERAGAERRARELVR
jgi:tetratricopeptide (TPR) repeat protein